MRATYRENHVEGQGREAHVRALLPETIERLRQACEGEEALASARPWGIARTGTWLTAMGVVAAVLLGPLAFSFGHIEKNPFAFHLPARAALLVACVAELLLLVLLRRSNWLTRGELPPGTYLFAAGVLDLRSGWVRVWPLEWMERLEQHGAVATLDFGPSGVLRMTTREEHLAGTLARMRTRLAQAIEQQDEAIFAHLDPCHREWSRSSFFPLARSARLPSAREALTPRRVALGALLVLGALLGGHLLAWQVSRWSDDLGIDLARRRGDRASLHSYLWRQGPLADEAALAWIALSEEATEEELVWYLSLPYKRQTARVERVLLRKVMRSTTPEALSWNTARGTSGENPSETLRQNMAEGIARVKRHLASGWPGETSRQELETRLFLLRIEHDKTLDCAVQEELLAPYLDRTDELGDAARQVRWRRLQRDSVRCRSPKILEQMRAMARTDAQRAEVKATWAAHFADGRRALILNEPGSQQCPRTPGQTLLSFAGERVDELMAYVADHPEEQMHTASSRGLDERITPQRRPMGDAKDTDWRPLVSLDTLSQVEAKVQDWPCHMQLLLATRSAHLDQWETRSEGPHLDIRKVSAEGRGPSVFEVTLQLPGRKVRRDRFVVP